MDPLTALGLASNIIQLISFTSDLISKGHEIYKSADGTLVEHLELEAIASNLQDLSTRISFPSDGRKERELSNADKQLRKLCNDCEAVSVQLIEAINGLKVRGPHKKWNSFRQALKSVWMDREIEELTRRLDRYRSEIDTTLLVSLREQMQRDDSTVSKYLGRGGLHGSGSNEETKMWQKNIMKELHLTRLELQNQQDMANFSMKVSVYSKETREQLFQEQILSKLRFTNIADRYERIEDAHRKTFEWIFLKDEDVRKKSTDTQISGFVDWLSGPETLYWITGKPGSGKSTLMKYLYNDPRTLRHLQAWAGQQQLTRAGFFFWNSGTAMQMSRMGLLQALLYESVGQCLERIPALFPARWKSYELFGGDLHPWSWSELNFAFKTLISEKSTRFFFFIDGLDEFDGDCGELADFALQHSANQNVKMCVASRPWLVFEDAFKRQPSLRVEELTAQDIQLFVLEKLRGNDMFIKHEMMQRKEAQDLIVEVADKASGVFLWVRLVVVSLIEGLRDGDNIKGLHNRLLLLPPDLEDLFFKILDNLNPAYFEEASKLFQIVHAADEPLSLLNLSLAEEGIEEAVAARLEVMSFDLAEFRAETMRRRLNSRCKGLLEAPTSINQLHLAPVQYLHRTVKDFFENPDRWEYILSGTSHSFDPVMSLCGSYLLQLKAVNMSMNILSSFTGEGRGVLGDLVALCIQYSLKFDEKNPALHIKTLKEIDQVVCKLFNRLSPSGEIWLAKVARYQSPQPEPFPTNPWVFVTGDVALPISSFFEYALRHRLYSYVMYELDAGYDSNSLCSDFPLLSTTISSWDTRMMQILFDHGADPNLNQAHESSTPWTWLLMRIYSKRAEEGDLHVAAEFVLKFLENNADVRVSVHRSSPEEIIKSVFQEWNAERTADLLAKLAVLKITQKSHKNPARGLKIFFKSIGGRYSKVK